MANRDERTSRVSIDHSSIFLLAFTVAAALKTVDWMQHMFTSAQDTLRWTRLEASVDERLDRLFQEQLVVQHRVETLANEMLLPFRRKPSNMDDGPQNHSGETRIAIDSIISTINLQAYTGPLLTGLD